ncbi:Mth938-like domain-containing protein [Candidatus Bathyarchaeota archaeon]|nr:Mth938-like domain-containing protein [Candidatus Bathyarchaeota archaeon]
MIEYYDFGVMIVYGKRYTRDLIILPDKIIDGWWRKEGHEICREDLKAILEHQPQPEVLVVGTGYSGLVKILADAESALKEHGIKLIAKPTGEAYKVFNELFKAGKNVAGAFHLTC